MPRPNPRPKIPILPKHTATSVRNEIIHMEDAIGRLVGRNPQKATQMKITLRTKRSILKKIEARDRKKGH